MNKSTQNTLRQVATITTGIGNYLQLIAITCPHVSSAIWICVSRTQTKATITTGIRNYDDLETLLFIFSLQNKLL